MNNTKDTSDHDKVAELLARRHLHEAFRVLATAVRKKSGPSLSDFLSKQEETYKYLLHYLVEGYADASRSEMLDEIIAALHFVNDSILRDCVIVDSPDLYSSTLRFERIRKATLRSRLDEYRQAQAMTALAEEAGGDPEIRKKRDDALTSLFSFVWTMFGASSDSYRMLSDACAEKDIPFEFKAQVISALFLGNLSYFDSKGLSCLLDIYDKSDNPRIAARALTSIVLIIAAYPDRVRSHPDLMRRLSLWQDSIIIYRQLREVVMSIIRAHDTQRISSKMQNEVLPELMKLQPEILKRLGKMSEGADLETLEENPEWEEIVSKNGLGDKLKELTDMQMDGGDVMMPAFSNLKGFPFFNSVANWFIPFYPTHHEVAKIAEGSLGVFNEILDSEGVMCDSDKYSFMFSLSQLPEAQRKMMTSQMESQLSQLKEVMAERKLKSSLPEFDQETTRYVRDIYRFFKLFRKKDEFRDPFNHPLDFISLPVIGDILSDPEILNLVGEFYFQRGYYTEALPLLLRLEGDSPDAGLFWEKIGYCYNALGRLEKAVEWYRKAELIHPDSKWLMKKLALCYRLLKKYRDAAEYYAKALESDPDNYQLLLNAGNSLLNAGDVAAALSHYYHADYVKPNSLSVWRAIAWGELLRKDYKKSLEFYTRILNSGEAAPSDYLNAGHAYFLLGEFRKASRSYADALGKDPEYDIVRLEEAMLEDINIIEQCGGKGSDLLLILENVKYSL